MNRYCQLTHSLCQCQYCVSTHCREGCGTPPGMTMVLAVSAYWQPLHRRLPMCRCPCTASLLSATPTRLLHNYTNKNSCKTQTGASNDFGGWVGGWVGGWLGVWVVWGLQRGRWVRNLTEILRCNLGLLTVSPSVIESQQRDATGQLIQLQQIVV